jgi:hypothetical protein
MLYCTLNWSWNQVRLAVLFRYGCGLRGEPGRGSPRSEVIVIRAAIKIFPWFWFIPQATAILTATFTAHFTARRVHVYRVRFVALLRTEFLQVHTADDLTITVRTEACTHDSSPVFRAILYCTLNWSWNQVRLTTFFEVRFGLRAEVGNPFPNTHMLSYF